MLHDEVHVLVVDDSSDAAETMAQFLELDGYTVPMASDGVDALRKVDEQLPHCVILDVNMPGMDGFDLARELRRAHGGEIVLIAVTGMGDKSERVVGTIELVDHFLKKPVDPALVKKLLPPARL